MIHWLLLLRSPVESTAGSIHGMLEATGGISPPQRRKRRCALTQAEREEISGGLATGESFRAIAARLGRSASTVCREVNRNGGCRRYRAAEAEEQALKRSRHPRRCLLAMNERLRDMVAQKLREDWSPEQISGWLFKHYSDDEARRVEKGTTCPLAKRADDAQGAPRLHRRSAARTDQRSRLDP